MGLEFKNLWGQFHPLTLFREAGNQAMPRSGYYY